MPASACTIFGIDPAVSQPCLDRSSACIPDIFLFESNMSFYLYSRYRSCCIPARSEYSFACTRIPGIFLPESNISLCLYSRYRSCCNLYVQYCNIIVSACILDIDPAVSWVHFKTLSGYSFAYIPGIFMSGYIFRKVLIPNFLCKVFVCISGIGKLVSTNVSDQYPKYISCLYSRSSSRL
jgi:hypothetical protein